MARVLFFFVFSLAASPISAADSFKAMAKEFANACRKYKVNKVVVVEFVSMDRRATPEGKNVAERLTTQLTRLEDIVVVERIQLDRVIEEHKLISTESSLPDHAKKLGRILAADAIVTGSVLPSKHQLEIHARMIDVETGRILHAAVGELELKRPEGLCRHGPKVCVWDESSAKTPWGRNCGGAAPAIVALEEKVLGLKARYWAAKMKEPGFSYANLLSVPGAEIPNPNLRLRFYELLRSWYRQDNTSELTLQELEILTRAEQQIMQIMKVCG